MLERVNFSRVRIHLQMMMVQIGEMSQVDDCLSDVTFLEKIMDVRLKGVVTKRIPENPLSQVDEFEQGKLEIGQTVGLGNGMILQ